MAKKRENNMPKTEDVLKKSSGSKLKKSHIILIIISASVLLALVIGLAIYFIVDYHKRDPKFDYLTSDLSEYIEFANDYASYDISIAWAPLREKDGEGKGISDVEVAILNLRAKGREIAGDGTKQANLTVGAGDNVYIWYRGYLKHPETGEQVVVSGMSNFSNENSYELGIGTGSFVPGFELGLLDTDPSQYARFKKITAGKIDSTKHIAYVTYTRKLHGSTSSNDTVTYKNVRIDLSDTETVEENFGTGFLEAINGQEVGAELKFSTTMNEKQYDYSKTTVNFVTTCEKESTNGGLPIKVVECYFPYDYSSTYLRNETAYFEVYIEFVQDYTADEWDDEFVKELLEEENSEITEAELVAKYSGETLTARYEQYIKDSLVAELEEERKSLVEEKMWDHYIANATVLRYPGDKVNEIYKEYERDVYDQFEKTGGQLQDSSTEEYVIFDNIDEFAVAYLGLSEGADWKATLKTMSESLVKERLILYYIMRDADLTPDADTLAAKITAIKQEYLDEYILQYLENDDETRADYTDDEFAVYVEERKAELFDYYDDAYFTETAYYEIVMETIINYPVVSDLRDGSYPYAKTE